MKKSLRLIIILSIMISGLAIGQEKKTELLPPGTVSPSFYLRTLDNQDFFLRDFCGKKLRKPWLHKQKYTVILSFFATWCHPCREEIPVLTEWYKSLNDSTVKVFLIAVAEKQNVVAPYVEKMKFELPVLLDPYNMTAGEKYGIKTLPSLYIIDPEGIIRYSSTGYHGKEELIKTLDETLKAIRNSK